MPDPLDIERQIVRRCSRTLCGLHEVLLGYMIDAVCTLLLVYIYVLIDDRHVIGYMSSGTKSIGGYAYSF